MRNFLKTFLTGKKESPLEEKQKAEQKRFEIFKYDGVRAGRMGRLDYAVKCFTEALAIRQDFETMGYLAQTYIRTNRMDEARRLLGQMVRMEPTHTDTRLTLANVCYMQEDYAAMAEEATKVIEAEEGNAMAHYLLGKAKNGEGDGPMCIAHLTRAIVLRDDFVEARLLRAEALVGMHQYKEAREDIEAILAGNPDDESALLLRGRTEEATGEAERAEESYRRVTEVNPFNEQAYLLLGKFYIAQKRLTEAVGLFTEAIELNPGFAAAYHERGRARLLNGDKEGAAEDMKRGLELDPKEMEGVNGEYENRPLLRTSDILGL